MVEVEDGKARDYYGDYEYYLWKKAQELESIKESSDALAPPKPSKPKGRSKPDAAPSGPPQPKQSERRELSKSLARLEKQIARSEAEIADLETRIRNRDQELADPKVYQEFPRWNQLHLEQELWKRDLDKLTARWGELSQDLEAVKTKLEGQR